MVSVVRMVMVAAGGSPTVAAPAGTGAANWLLMENSFTSSARHNTLAAWVKISFEIYLHIFYRKYKSDKGVERDVWGVGGVWGSAGGVRGVCSVYSVGTV